MNANLMQLDPYYTHEDGLLDTLAPDDGIADDGHTFISYRRRPSREKMDELTSLWVALKAMGGERRLSRWEQNSIKTIRSYLLCWMVQCQMKKYKTTDGLTTVTRKGDQIEYKRN